MKAETKTVRCLKKTPSYKLTAHDGSIVAQHHYTGHTHAIVYFLASAANPRCRAYCQELNERVAAAKTYKTVVVAIAPEPAWSTLRMTKGRDGWLAARVRLRRRVNFRRWLV